MIDQHGRARRVVRRRRAPGKRAMYYIMINEVIRFRFVFLRYVQFEMCMGEYVRLIYATKITNEKNG